MYSWFSNYKQDCLKTENCQQRGVEIAQSTDVWLYNVVTKAIVEMVSPVNEKPTLSANNKNGFMASILAWVREKDEVIGEETFPGFQLYNLDDLDDVEELTSTCKTALSQTIRCSPFLKTLRYPNTGKYIDNSTEADMICAPGCGKSLKSWFDNVSSSCTDQSLGYSDPTTDGGYIYAAYNQTCFKDPKTGQYCQSIINEYPTVESITSLSLAEMCSHCFTQKYVMMQASAYTAYDVRAQDNLKIINEQCGLHGPTDLPESLVKIPDPPTPFCLSGITYTIQKNDTCDNIAQKYSVASAAILDGNSDLINDCSHLISGREICLPLSCEKTYTLRDNDTCWSIEMESGLDIEYGGVRNFNPWVNIYCTNLQSTRPIIGSVICISPQGGTYNDGDFHSNSTTSGPSASTGYTEVSIKRPENATVAEGTAWFCGLYHTVTAGETCTSICMEDRIPIGLFLEANPSLSPDDCNGNLVEGLTYCTGPNEYWNDPHFWGSEWPGSPAGPTSSTAMAGSSSPTSSS